MRADPPARIARAGRRAVVAAALVLAAHLPAAAPAVAAEGDGDGLAAVDWLPRPFHRGEDIARRLADLEAGETLELDAGTHVLAAPLVIARDGVTIRGAGVDRTVLVATFGGRDTAVLDIRGMLAREAASAGRCTPLGGAAVAGGARLSLARPPEIARDGILAVRAPNDDAFLDAIGSRVWRRQYPYLRWTMARVEGVDGARVLLDRPLAIEMPATGRACPVDAVEGVSVTDLSVVYRPAAPADPSLHENAAPAALVDGIRVMGAVGAVIERVRVVNAGRHPVHLDETLDARLEDVALCGAINKGTGGTGYLRIARSRDARLSRIVVRGLRHVAIQWSTHDSRIDALDSDTGVDFHGGWTRRNTVTGSVVVRQGHPFPTVRETPTDARWAPPGGPGDSFASASVAPPAIDCGPPLPFETR